MGSQEPWGLVLALPLLLYDVEQNTSPHWASVSSSVSEGSEARSLSSTTVLVFYDVTYLGDSPENLTQSLTQTLHRP